MRRSSPQTSAHMADLIFVLIMAVRASITNNETNEPKKCNRLNDSLGVRSSVTKKKNKSNNNKKDDSRKCIEKTRILGRYSSDNVAIYLYIIYI